MKQLCPQCGNVMWHEDRPCPVIRKGKSARPLVKAWWCNYCTEMLLDGEAIEILEKAYNELKGQNP